MDKRASSISGDLELKQFFSDFDQKWNATQNNSIMLHNVPDIAVLSLSDQTWFFIILRHSVNVQQECHFYGVRNRVKT